MLILAHRVNDFIPGNTTSADGAEIDVQVCDDGVIRAKHDPCWNQVPPLRVSTIIEKSGYNKFFVDVKQSLKPVFIKLIADQFGDKLLGLFDIPMPSVYFTPSLRLPIYIRVSELEPYNRNFNKVWLDPLKSHSPSRYGGLLTLLPSHSQVDVIVACPSLHGKSLRECKQVWSYLKNKNIQGIVTKHVEVCREIFNA